MIKNIKQSLNGGVYISNAALEQELKNFIDYLCRINLFDCNKNDRVKIIDDYILYYEEKRKKAANVRQYYLPSEDSFYQQYHSMLENTGDRLTLEAPLVNRITTNQIEKAREFDNENKLKFYREQLQGIKHILTAEMYHLENKKLKDTNLRLHLNTTNKIYTLNYNGDNEKIKELVKDFNQQLLDISNKLLIDTSDFINIPNLDYDRLILELGKITLEIGELSNKLMNIKEQSGGKPGKYKSTGITVFILYKNKKYNRAIYVKDKGTTKYCKINNKYILLSKLKVVL
jgi:hypothetical protein